VAGIAGSGQKELCEALAGLYPVADDFVTYHLQSGQTTEIVGKKEIKQMGITFAYVPEDCLGMGLAAASDLMKPCVLWCRFWAVHD